MTVSLSNVVFEDALGQTLGNFKIREFVGKDIKEFNGNLNEREIKAARYAIKQANKNKKDISLIYIIPQKTNVPDVQTYEINFYKRDEKYRGQRANF